MSKHFLNNGISELNCGSNFAYLFEGSDSFVPMQYKVMRNQTSGFLLPCTKVQYNGKVQLYYQTKNKKPFSEMQASLRGDSLLLQIYEIVRAVIQVQSVGFLRGENINLAYDKIFVDLATNRVSLVYLPCMRGFYENAAVMESTLRAGLVVLLNSLAEQSEKKAQLLAALSSPSVSLQDILKNAAISPKSNQVVAVAKKQLHLRSSYHGKEIDIPVTKEVFVIGRDPLADYVVTFNDYIGRKHCRISMRGDQFYIVDLNSTNHTFLNQKLLKPGIEYLINNGDRVALANSSFDVVIA